jgi:nucleotide-binding universal stress UspA family protein
MKVGLRRKDTMDQKYCPVSKLETLLVATDRSPFSEGAIREATNLAKTCSSKLCVMTVLETNPEYESIGAEFLAKEEEEALQYLLSVKKEAEKEMLTCEAVLRRGDSPSRLIVREAEEKKADVIIIGRRGRKGLAKVIMGSSAAKVIGRAPCTVLVVPKAAKIEYSNILVASDGSEHAAAAVSEAVEIAKRSGGHLIALSAILSEEQADEAKVFVGDAAETAREAGVAMETITPIGKPHDVIVETASGRGVDLIVMGAYGKTGLKKLLMGSTTEKVVGLAGCAVLIVKARGGEG